VIKQLNVVFRVDASPSIGAGHLVRCMALAEYLLAYGMRVYFVCRNISDTFAAKVDGLGCTLLRLDPSAGGEGGGGKGGENCLGFTPDREAAQVGDALGSIAGGVGWLIVDHYAIDAACESILRSAASRIMVIDDLANRPHDCDLLLDQSPIRTELDYRRLCPKTTYLLLGTAYALLRKEFFAARQRVIDERIRRSKVKRLLVSFGSTDPGNATVLVLQALQRAGVDLAVDVAIGSDALHLDEMYASAASVPFPVHIHIDAFDMADLMMAADVAIGAAGVSAWERCALGLPSVVLQVADNQHANMEALVSAGAAKSLGNIERSDVDQIGRVIGEILTDSNLIAGMSRRAMRLCDGVGAGRVAAELGAPRARDGQKVRLRPVTHSDEELMLRWQKKPAVRKFARNPKPPSAEEHHLWLAEKLSDLHCVFNMILHGDEPAGVLRLDKIGRVGIVYEVSIFVAPTSQRQGLATAALQLIRIVFPEAELTATVLPDNQESHALFRQAGYRWVGEKYVSMPITVYSKTRTSS